MKRLNENKDELFIKQYLYNKLLHVDKYSFYCNFSDISYDLRPYIESNYFDYVNVNYEDINDTYADDATLKHLNMLHRSYINKYTWVRRNELLELLKRESSEPNYVLHTEVKDYLVQNGLDSRYINKINNRFKEWKTLNAYTMPKNKDCTNSELALAIKDDIASKIVALNMDNEEIGIDYNFNLIIKSKKNKNYYSGRAYNNVCYTRNDLEKKHKNYWDKEIEDNRECRSDYFKLLEERGFYVIDLGDMSSNFPNMLHCIKTGTYEDIDFHSKIATENGISRAIAKMAAVRCCFNCKKVDVLYGLLDKADISTLSTEIKTMEESGIFCIKDGKVGLCRGRKLSEAHEFFNNKKDNAFFSYCNDFLTSWDVCHNVYKNDLAPSDLSMLTSAVEVTVIYNAMQKGFRIVNAFDHAYLITKNKDDYYDWKGEYKKTAEELVSKYKNQVIVKNGKSRCAISKVGIFNNVKRGDKIALKLEVRNFLKEHNYDIEVAAEHFNWKPQWKYYWKKLVKEGKI